MSFVNCERCANTGILNASLVEKNDVKKIAVIACGDHKTNEMLEKSLEAMHKGSGFNVEVLKVDKSKK